MVSPDHATEVSAMEYHISHVLEAREDKIINEIVDKYKRGNIDYEFLLSKIAIISELRALKNAFHRETLDAIDDVEQEYGRG